MQNTEHNRVQLAECLSDIKERLDGYRATDSDPDLSALLGSIKVALTTVLIILGGDPRK